MTAAYELDRAGWDVTVLEARSRVGGRVWTMRFAGGQHAEAGGEYIDTTHTHMRAYARRLGLPLEDLRELEDGDRDDAAFLGGRRRVLDELYTDEAVEEITRYEGRLFELADPLDPVDPVDGGAALDKRSAADLLDELELGSRARFLIETFLREDYTVEPRRLSLLFLAQQEKLGENLPESGIEAFRIRGGNDRLPRAFAKRLEGRIRLRTPVTAIASRSDGVEVRAAGRTYSADRCVLATPLIPVRSMTFDPPLPPATRAAVAGLAYGRAVKTLLHYRRRTWREQGYTGSALTDLASGSCWEATDDQPGSAGALIAYAGGARGARFGRLSAGERAHRAARDIDRVFPGSRSELRRSLSIAWAKERYTGGSYTAYAPGQVTRFWRAVRKPHGRVHMAGEHTDAYTAYMEGAVRSGARAARSVRAAEE